MAAVASHRLLMRRSARGRILEPSFPSYFAQQVQIRLTITSISFSSASIHGKSRAVLNMLFIDSAVLDVAIQKRGCKGWLAQSTGNLTTIYLSLRYLQHSLLHSACLYVSAPEHTHNIIQSSTFSPLPLHVLSISFHTSEGGDMS